MDREGSEKNCSTIMKLPSKNNINWVLIVHPRFRLNYSKSKCKNIEHFRVIISNELYKSLYFTCNSIDIQFTHVNIIRLTF